MHLQLKCSNTWRMLCHWMTSNLFLYLSDERAETCFDWLIDWLVFYGTSTQDRSICANLPGGYIHLHGWPISNSSDALKLLEWRIAKQVTNHHQSNYFLTERPFAEILVPWLKPPSVGLYCAGSAVFWMVELNRRELANLILLRLVSPVALYREVLSVRSFLCYSLMTLHSYSVVENVRVSSMMTISNCTPYYILIPTTTICKIAWTLLMTGHRCGSLTYLTRSVTSCMLATHKANLA